MTLHAPLRMRILLPVVLALVLFPAASLHAQDAPAPSTSLRSDSVDWIPFDEALASARDGDRKILVFVYTQWCGWCRKMLDSTFTDQDVNDYMNGSFATVRLDAESSSPVKLEAKSPDGEPLDEVSEAQLAMALGASGFPTTVFLESDGRYITRLPSYLGARDYYNVLRYIGEDLYKSQSYEEYLQTLDG